MIKSVANIVLRQKTGGSGAEYRRITMPSRTDYIEALDAIENGMIRVSEDDGIWQNRLIYVMCHAIRLLLIWVIKHNDAKR